MGAVSIAAAAAKFVIHLATAIDINGSPELTTQRSGCRERRRPAPKR
jgi:hypothetical protein